MHQHPCAPLAHGDLSSKYMSLSRQVCWTSAPSSRLASEIVGKVTWRTSLCSPAPLSSLNRSATSTSSLDQSLAADRFAWNDNTLIAPSLPQLGLSLETMTNEMLGKATRVSVSKERTTMIATGDHTAEVAERIKVWARLSIEVPNRVTLEAFTFCDRLLAAGDQGRE